MSDELQNLIKLAGSGTAPLLAAWAVYRIGRLEARIDALAAALGAAPRQRRQLAAKILSLIGLILPMSHP